MNEDEQWDGAETTGAVERAAEAILDACYGQELPEAPIDLARAALTAALTDKDATRDPAVDDLTPGSLARRLWATALTDGDGGLTPRDARVLAAAVRAHLLGGAA